MNATLSKEALAVDIDRQGNLGKEGEVMGRGVRGKERVLKRLRE